MKYPSTTFVEQRVEFSNHKFLATPLTGLVIYSVIGIVFMHTTNNFLMRKQIISEAKPNTI